MCSLTASVFAVASSVLVYVFLDSVCLCCRLLRIGCMYSLTVSVFAGAFSILVYVFLDSVCLLTALGVWLLIHSFLKSYFVGNKSPVSCHNNIDFDTRNYHHIEYNDHNDDSNEDLGLNIENSDDGDDLFVFYFAVLFFW